MKKGKGLTLIELVVTLAVALILLTMGIPMFSSITANNRATTQTNSIVTALQVARSEAVKRGLDVGVCPMKSGSCVSDWTNSSWDDPDETASVFVFSDENGNGSFDSGTDGEIAVLGPFHTGLTIKDSTSLLFFSGTGLLETPNTGATLCLEQLGATGGTPIRAVTVSVTGVIRTERLSELDASDGNGTDCP